MKESMEMTIDELSGGGLVEVHEPSQKIARQQVDPSLHCKAAAYWVTQFRAKEYGAEQSGEFHQTESSLCVCVCFQLRWRLHHPLPRSPETVATSAARVLAYNT